MTGKQRFYVLFVIAAILFFSTTLLLVQNNYYRNVNRQLILQNDSIISVNIHLKDTLKKEAEVSLSLNDAETN
jgi:hypothetical protein